MKSTEQDHINDVNEMATGVSNRTVDFRGARKQPVKQKTTALDPRIRNEFECLDKAIDYFGSISELARAIDSSAPNVHYWHKKTGLIPCDRALRIHELTEGFIDMEDVLRENERVRLINKTTY